MPTSLKAIFRDSLFITKVKVLLQCRSSEGFFFPAGTKKGINGLFPFSGKSDLKGAFKTIIKQPKQFK